MDPVYEKRLLRQLSWPSPTKSPQSPGKTHGSPKYYKSPSQDSYGDRFIPSRSAVNKCKGMLTFQDPELLQAQQNQKDQSIENRENSVYLSLLKNEVLGTELDSVKDMSDTREPLRTPVAARSLFKIKTPKRSLSYQTIESSSPYSLSPVSAKSQALLKSPKKPTRKISKVPFKVLDAPDLQDDFYLNLVDWSSQNVLGVGLGRCVYLWSAFTRQVTKLCDLSSERDSITSVGWADKGNLLGVGTHQGFIQIWDVAASKKIDVIEGHSARVGSLAWNADLLCSGSRDRLILKRDIRAPVRTHARLVGHRQEVCGLKWSPDKSLLASGGNDNKLLIWNSSSLTPLQQLTDHTAAVKAIAWSPHQRGLLASGGGTVDRCIRFWNTQTGKCLNSVDTGSQVCNLAWSKHSNELVSTHGYSQNQIRVWKYPSLQHVTKLTGHSYRVLYLAMSPDGESIVTGAGDETLRFWNIFSKSDNQQKLDSQLDLFTQIR